MRTTVTPHAWGLMFPTHMEWVNDGQLLVSAPGGGVIYDITKSGDYFGAAPFVTGMEVPGGIVQLPDGRILASDRTRNAVFDITRSGRVAESDIHSTGLSFPYGLIFHRDQLYVTEDNVRGIESRLTNITGGGHVIADSVHVGGFPIGRFEYMGRDVEIMRNGSWGGTGYGDMILLSNGHLGTIFDVTEKSSYSAMIEKGDRRFAWGLGSPLGMHANPVDKLMYVVDTTRGCLYQLPKEGGNMRFAPAMATGFIEPSCVRWHRDGKYAFVCDKRAGVVFKIVVDEW